MHRVSLLTLSLMFALPAAAEIYQWRDAQGRINYSDTPPATEKAQKLRAASRSGAPAAGEDEPQKGTDAGAVEANGMKPDAAKTDTGKAGAAKTDLPKPKTIAEKEVEFRQRRAAAAEVEAKAEKERQQAAERARSCDQARGQLTTLKTGQRVARYDSNGKRELLDDAGRSAEIERTQQYIDATCK